MKGNIDLFSTPITYQLPSRRFVRPLPIPFILEYPISTLGDVQIRSRWLLRQSKPYYLSLREWLDRHEAIDAGV